MIKFSDWLLNVKESSAFTRLRWNAALGLAPPIPDASMHSRSTAAPWMLEKKKKKKKKKKKNKKNESLDFTEAKKLAPVKHKEIDNWLGEVDKLKAALSSLKDVISKKKKEPKVDSKIDKEEKVDKRIIKDKVDDKDEELNDIKKEKIINNDRNNPRAKDSEIKVKVNKKTREDNNSSGSSFKK